MGLVGLHAGSDAVIALSCGSIAAGLFLFVWKKKDVPFPRMFQLFGAFLFACGLTHAMEIWTLWVPAYWLSGAVKLAAAAVSAATAVLLVPLLPKALALRGPAELEASNRELEKEIAERRRAERELARRADELDGINRRLVSSEAELVRRAELLVRSNTNLEQFAYVASHDLQEPLRKIIGFGDRLRVYADGAPFDQKGRDMLSRMEKAALRMRRLIEDLLQYSRVETAEREAERLPLRELVDEALGNLEARVVAAGAKIDAEGLPKVRGNRTQLVQLFQNLIGNALKFRRAETAPIVSIRSRAVGNGFVEIEVEDNGIGFEEKYLDRIFKPFQRLHGVSEYEGSGIGLAICAKIVELHGGRLTARSRPGSGSVFVLSLPEG